MFKRMLEDRLREALTDTRVVLVNGPRRAGKTTLVRDVAGKSHQYVTLDDDTVLNFALEDPQGFLRGFDRVIIDEVQRAPNLLLAIKRAVDEDSRPGRFLLTGSANVMSLPKVADSLAGRIEILTLMPLSQAEILGGSGDFISSLFAGRPKAPRKLLTGTDLVSAVAAGGFPEALSRLPGSRRSAWFRAYVESVLARDIPDIAEVRLSGKFRRFADMIAVSSGQLMNAASLGRDAGISNHTAKAYVDLLEKVFLVKSVDPWFVNELQRLIKTPKVHMTDTGVLCQLRGLSPQAFERDRSKFGAVLETFVFSEIRKMAAVAEEHTRLYHFRTHQGEEVDVILERKDGTICGVEVKAAASVSKKEFRGMTKLKEVCGSRFVCGVVLYDGDAVIPFGDGMFAAPLSCLWN